MIGKAASYSLFGAAITKVRRRPSTLRFSMIHWKTLSAREKEKRGLVWSQSGPVGQGCLTRDSSIPPCGGFSSEYASCVRRLSSLKRRDARRPSTRVQPVRRAQRGARRTRRRLSGSGGTLSKKKPCPCVVERLTRFYRSFHFV